MANITKMLTDNKDNDLAKKIYEENVRVHRFEAAIYERIHPEIFNPRVQQELQEDLSLVRKLLPSPSPLALDIGCGTGNISIKLLKLGFRVTAVDISQEMLDVFQEKVKKIPEAGYNLNIICLDIDSFLGRKDAGRDARAPKESSSYDCVTIHSVLHHLPHYSDTIRQVSKLLSNEGLIYISHEPLAKKKDEGKNTEHRRQEPENTEGQGAKGIELRAKSKDAGRDARAPGALCSMVHALSSVFDSIPLRLWMLFHGITPRDHSLSDYHVQTGIDDKHLAKLLSDCGFEIIVSRKYTPWKTKFIDTLARQMHVRPSCFKLLARKQCDQKAGKPESRKARKPESRKARKPESQKAGKPESRKAGFPVFKVCMVIATFYPMMGGAEKQARKLAKRIVARGIPVSVLTRNYGNYAPFEIIDGIKVYRTPLLGKSMTIASSSYISLGLFWLIKHSMDYNIIHCHQLVSPATLGVLAKKLLDKKKVIVKVSTTGQFSEAAAVERMPFTRLRKRLLRDVNRFVVINPKMTDEVQSLGISSSNITYIPNGVDIPPDCAYEPVIKQKYRALLGLDYQILTAASRAGALSHKVRDPKIVLFVGRLSAEKNLDILLHAWKQTTQKHPNAHLLILGEGSAFRNAEAEIRQLALDLQLNDRVYFLGRINNVNSYLLAGDIFVLPSSTEGMSNALLEAMAAGNGIVASNIPGNAQLITDSINGLLVPPGDVTSLSSALNRLLIDSTLTAKLGKAAKQSAIENFSIDGVADRYIKLYTKLVN